MEHTLYRYRGVKRDALDLRGRSGTPANTASRFTPLYRYSVCSMLSPVSGGSSPLRLGREGEEVVGVALSAVKPALRTSNRRAARLGRATMPG